MHVQTCCFAHTINCFWRPRHRPRQRKAKVVLKSNYSTYHFSLFLPEDFFQLFHNLGFGLNKLWKASQSWLDSAMSHMNKCYVNHFIFVDTKFSYWRENSFTDKLKKWRTGINDQGSVPNLPTKISLRADTLKNRKLTYDFLETSRLITIVGEMLHGFTTTKHKQPNRV